VRSERMQAIRTRKGSRDSAATTASAVGFQSDRVPSSRLMTSPILRTCP